MSATISLRAQEDEIIVTVEGGLVQDIDFGQNVPRSVWVHVHDYDIDGADTRELDTDENGDQCAVSTFEPNNKMQGMFTVYVSNHARGGHDLYCRHFSDRARAEDVYCALAAVGVVVGMKDPTRIVIQSRGPQVESPKCDRRFSIATHTPGPWTAQTSQPHDHRAWHVRNREISRGVCDISPDAWENTGENEIEANARLIAAAPDLLSAARGILQYEGHAGKTHTTIPEWDALIAAIAKAEGR
jgi:hypothetical protein